jgi:hypothetical protein
MAEEKFTTIDDFSGLVNRGTNYVQRLNNELHDAGNVRTSKEVGSINSALGYTQEGDDLTSTSSTSTSSSTTITTTSTSTTTTT